MAGQFSLTRPFWPLAGHVSMEIRKRFAGSGEQRPSLPVGWHLGGRVRRPALRSPTPHVGCIQPDAEKIGRHKSELRGLQSDDTHDDAVCSGKHPAMPQFFPNKHRRENRQNTGKVIKPKHVSFSHPALVCSKSSHSQSRAPREDAKLGRANRCGES